MILEEVSRTNMIGCKGHHKAVSKSYSAVVNTWLLFVTPFSVLFLLYLIPGSVKGKGQKSCCDDVFFYLFRAFFLQKLLITIELTIFSSFIVETVEQLLGSSHNLAFFNLNY